MIQGLALSAITLGVGSYSAFAATADQAVATRPAPPDRAAVEAAIAADDYAAFSGLTANSPRALEEAAFEILVQAHQLRDAGDQEGAHALLEANNLLMPKHGMMRPGEGKGDAEEGTDRPDPETMRARREAARAAIQANDYNAWVTAMADAPHAETFVTQEHFDALVQAEVLIQAGDREGAKALLDAAGIRPPRGPMRGHGLGLEQPRNET